MVGWRALSDNGARPEGEKRHALIQEVCEQRNGLELDALMGQQ